MGKYIISTDSACDLPKEYLEEHGVAEVSLFYNIDGVMYGGSEGELSPTEFHDLLAQGKTATTSAVSPEDLKNTLRPYLAQGYDVLHLAFSSGLSSTCQNSILAAQYLEEEFPDRKVMVVDTKCASLGQGFLVHKCVELKEKGMDMDVLAKWAEDHIQNTIHLFTVDNLDSLYRGGRVSKATAIVAGLANIKPVLRVDEKGCLVGLKNVRGRKKSLVTLCDLMIEYMKGYSITNDTFFISHSDCQEDAQNLAAMIRDRTGIKSSLISTISPTIGAHTGRGCIALFFFGKQR